eukprot:3814475-Pleurochrysis_carterae.AAC.8
MQPACAGPGFRFYSERCSTHSDETAQSLKGKCSMRNVLVRASHSFRAYSYSNHRSSLPMMQCLFAESTLSRVPYVLQWLLRCMADILLGLDLEVCKVRKIFPCQSNGRSARALTIVAFSCRITEVRQVG